MDTKCRVPVNPRQLWTFLKYNVSFSDIANIQVILPTLPNIPVLNKFVKGQRLKRHLGYHTLREG